MVLQVLSPSLSLPLSFSLLHFPSPCLPFLVSLTLSSSLAFVGALLPNPRQFQLDKPRQDHLVFLVELSLYSNLYRNDCKIFKRYLPWINWSSEIECLYFSISIEKLYYNFYDSFLYPLVERILYFSFFIFCKYVTHHIFCYNLFVSRYTRMILVAPTPLEHPSRVFSRKKLVHLFLADVQEWGRSTVGECRII